MAWNEDGWRLARSAFDSTRRAIGSEPNFIQSNDINAAPAPIIDGRVIQLSTTLFVAQFNSSSFPHPPLDPFRFSFFVFI